VKVSGWKLLMIGQLTIFAAIIILLVSKNTIGAVMGLFLTGLGNGPVFPNMTHLTPIQYKREPRKSKLEKSCSRILCLPLECGKLSTMHLKISCYVSEFVIITLPEDLEQACFRACIRILHRNEGER